MSDLKRFTTEHVIEHIKPRHLLVRDPATGVGNYVEQKPIRATFRLTIDVPKLIRLLAQQCVDAKTQTTTRCSRAVVMTLIQKEIVE